MPIVQTWLTKEDYKKYIEIDEVKGAWTEWVHNALNKVGEIKSYSKGYEQAVDDVVKPIKTPKMTESDRKAYDAVPYGQLKSPRATLNGEPLPVTVINTTKDADLAKYTNLDSILKDQLKSSTILKLTKKDLDFYEKFSGARSFRGYPIQTGTIDSPKDAEKATKWAGSNFKKK